MSRPGLQIGRRLGLGATFLVVGPIAGGLTFPLVVVIDRLIWPENTVRFALAGMVLVGVVLTILPSLIAGVAGAVTSRVWKGQQGWLAQAAAIGAVMTMLEGVLFALLSGPGAATLFQTTQSATRTLMLIVLFALVGAAAGLAGATATQAWRPKSLTKVYAETFD
ncbi:MAG: hypothetical protein JHC81_07615 [Brevundimonas sp.]|uniref:hypothetical protein n=1 Tax=Brevundimonas sp. TaxID=1871086 RepID=UPI001A2F3069|nr:hypothetical protein [Brevundimonas sp.]MBJ7447387.1 hypothetical protein [Brevundimonas sp.]